MVNFGCNIYRSLTTFVHCCKLLPYFTLLLFQCDQVIVTTETGRVSILPGHPATRLALKPGVVSLVNGNHTTKYFVSSGFAFIHGHSRVDIATDHEAIPLDHFDLAEIQKGLAEFTLKLSSASTDMEKAEALIGLEVNSALNAALQAS
ncbi:hypothetical protein MKX03_032987 [Papaver bracteatum]|nr:hypothetical protein MKX03_032987 [Papaver bracteatum]